MRLILIASALALAGCIHRPVPPTIHLDDYAKKERVRDIEDGLYMIGKGTLEHEERIGDLEEWAEARDAACPCK